MGAALSLSSEADSLDGDGRPQYRALGPGGRHGHDIAVTTTRPIVPRRDEYLPSSMDVPLDLYVDSGTLDSGDLILFRGMGWCARLIQWWTGCPYSHIGVVLRIGDDLYLLESVGHQDPLESRITDLMQLEGLEPRRADTNWDRPNPRADQVRLVLLRDRLRQYCLDAPSFMERRLEICFLKTRLYNPYRRIEATAALYAFAKRACGHQYDSSALNFLRNSYPHLSLGLGPATAQVDQLAQYTCTQLVAAALQEMRILNSLLPIQSIQTPRQFVDGTIDARYWINGELEPVNLHLVIKLF
jgi:hypothetical protein